MSQAREIVEALQVYSQEVVFSNRINRITAEQFDREQVELVEKILGARAATSTPSTYDTSAHLVTHAMLFMVQCVMLEDKSPGSIARTNEDFRIKMEAVLIEFAAKVRTEVMQEVASGSGAADELLRKATT